jgi:integrase
VVFYLQFYPSEVAVAIDISKSTHREALPARDAPYWQRVARGCAIGFRRRSAAMPGLWMARHWDSATDRLVYHAIGTLESLPPAERFDEAKRQADSWFARVGAGAVVTIRTVEDACRAYVQSVRDDRERADAGRVADEIEARFRRLVYPDPLANVALPKLREKHVSGWRDRLIKLPAAVSRTKAGRTTRPRSPSTVNRDMTPLRAALNLACACGSVGSDIAWARALKPIENADGRRDEYLTREQRRALIDAAGDEIKPFLVALTMLPLRPGAMAKLTRQDYDERNKVLRITGDKGHKPREIKLPPKTADFFDKIAKSRLPAAPLLRRLDGSAWTKDSWKVPVKDAATAAGLPAGVSAYTLRHSTITDLVNDTDLPLLTVAQISGTSIAMIEKTYAKLRQDRAAAALATLGL